MKKQNTCVRSQILGRGENLAIKETSRIGLEVDGRIIDMTFHACTRKMEILLGKKNKGNRKTTPI